MKIVKNDQIIHVLDMKENDKAKIISWNNNPKIYWSYY